ncbi:MAG: C25 family cysteine peptidase, partial [Planctomycetota bacterium]
IDGREYVQISLGTESLIKNRGAPAVPSINRSIVIPGDTEMAVNVLASKYHDVADIAVAPDRGYISRATNPADVPYTFGKAYETDAFYPGALVTPHEPYIMRSQRGLLIQLNPLQYNPVSSTLRVYTDVTLEVVKVGPGKINVLTGSDKQNTSASFEGIYRNHFMNYAPAGGADPRYGPMDEEGDMLIICYDAWMTNMQPFVNHKNSIGITTSIVGVSTIPGGNTTTAIKNYIQGVYDTSDLAFVLLVGDAAQIATPQSAGYAADPSYSLLAGSDDYPEIMIGRFSAQNTGEVDTQVERSIEYEQMPAVEQPWFWKGTGIGSDQGTGDDGEYDYEHIRYIRTDLLAYGYTEVDELYDGSQGGADAAGNPSASMVASCLNAGRGIVNYVGHGSSSSWGTSGFSTTNINSLVNDNMLPFVISVACNNGQFDDYASCFGEAWLRATHGGEPTGAIGCYASSDSQPWDPPMEGQDEFNLLYVAEAYSTYGAYCFAGSCSMMDDYPGSAGTWGTGPHTFYTWHIFGDPSLQISGTPVVPTGLKVSPGQGLDSGGPVGGPFAPDSIVYTLENQNDVGSLSYSVSAGQAWVSIDDPSGSLNPHETTLVTVSINAYANALSVGSYSDTVNFVNTTDHDGDTTRPVALAVGVAALQYEWNMDANPGWSIEGQWAWGQPTGGGGEYGGPDPTNGHTGNNVCGYNLSGDYTNSMPEYNLTTTAIDCENMTEVRLKFWRWLGVEQNAYDHAYIRVSTNGSNWETVWSNGATVEDATWTQQEFDISEYADNEPTVYIRWTMGTTDGGWRYCGWNIDDVEIWGLLASNCALMGDMDEDGDCDGDDIQDFLLCKVNGGANCDCAAMTIEDFVSSLLN